jgi:hypothetical protein
VHWDKREGNSIPSLKDDALEPQVWALAAREDAAGVACLADGGFDKWTEVTTATEFVLYAKPSLFSETARPLKVYLALQIEGAPLECDVPWNYKQGKADPKQERVDGKERTIIEQDSGPPNEGSDEAGCSRQGGDNELWSIPNTDDVCVQPDVEPRQQTDDYSGDRVYRKLENSQRDVNGRGKGANENIGDKKRPFELVPLQLGVYYAAKPVAGDTIVILVVLAGHASLPAPESFHTTTTLWQPGGDLGGLSSSGNARRQEPIGEFGRQVVYAEGEILAPEGRLRGAVTG